ncbi:putative F-box protein [Raphanus sativus]|nr:putative F-box protein [Raphanus sativus]
MKKKLKPNSHKRLRENTAMKKKKLNSHSHKYLIGDTSKSWSDLPFDLLNLVFESLSFADFQRAKSVCSSWRSSSRQCVTKNHIPWVLRFPKDDENSCCIWLLMQNLQSNLFIVNLFTGENINLPPVESQFGMTKIQKSVFWIDEKTKDHVVAWALSKKCVVYSKRGDNWWNKIPKTSNFRDMAYKDHKLYFSSYPSNVNAKIFDFSGEIPQQIVIEEKHAVPLPVNFKPVGGDYWSIIVATNIVVTVTGDVLEVVKMWTSWEDGTSISSGFIH